MADGDSEIVNKNRQDACERYLIQLASRGNAIITELLRLKEYVPDVFLLKNKREQQKYGDIILDFVYFKTPDLFDQKIERSPQLLNLDSEIREENIEILRRFFLAFESIHKYVTNLNQFVDDIREGSVYAQTTLQSLFRNGETKQLMCEVLYLYGVMLLVLDWHIEGPVRERLLVSHYRYCAQRYSGSSTIDNVCKLLRSTGYENEKRPSQYPCEYFGRVTICEAYVNAVLNHLRGDDIYNQMNLYVDTDHRSTALSSQAAMLFVCLFFNGGPLLARNTTKMREITDKFFSDNWVVSVYMGLTVNVFDSWEPFKAAKSASSNILDVDNVNAIASSHHQKMKKYSKQTVQLCKKPELIEERIYENTDKLLNLCRDCNVTMRWLILHTVSRLSVHETSKRSKQTRDQILSFIKLDNEELLRFLLNVAHFELNLLEFIKQFLHNKETNWNLWKCENVSRMRDLSDVFTGNQPLMKIAKNDNLRTWFEDLANQIDALSLDDDRLSTRKITRFLNALENVKGFHQLSSHPQISDHIRETAKYLRKMDRLLNVKDDVLVDLQIICDFSYAWNAIDNFTPLMQHLVKSDPSSVIELRALFLKLSSALETPLMRINQAGSEDLISVSQYYSRELVSYLKRVLHIIPQTIFVIMTQIIQKQTKCIKEIPSRLDKDRVKEFAQIEERMEVARLTHDVSVLAEGILGMKSTLVGIVKINPRKLLENGIRKELVSYISAAIHQHLQFASSGTATVAATNDQKVSGSGNNRKALTDILTELSVVMDGYRRSFEYIRDYIGICGPKIWQEELSRVIEHNVRIECERLLRKKNQSASTNHFEDVPIPYFPSTDAFSANFVGRLLRELIRITDTKHTVYSNNSMAWFDSKTKDNVLDFRIFAQIRMAIGVSALVGLDKLLSLNIVRRSQTLIASLQQIMKEKPWAEYLSSAAATFVPNTKFVDNPSKTYAHFVSKTYKLPSTILESLLSIGQLQILRELILFELKIKSKFDSKQLYSCLEALNESVTHDVVFSNISSNEEHLGEIKNDGMNRITFFNQLRSLFNASGLIYPLENIYITYNPSTMDVDLFSLLLSLITLMQLSKLEWQSDTGSLVWKKCGEAVDGDPLITGLRTLFRQLHPNYERRYCEFLFQYLFSHTVLSDGRNADRNESNDFKTISTFLNIFTIHDSAGEMCNLDERTSSTHREVLQLLEILDYQ